jgi:iron complex outermembrane receptor protein
MSRNRTPRFARARLLVAVLSCFAVGSAAADNDGLDAIVDLPFEQLLKTEIITADKLARQISDAPSAVSIVTAEDIRAFGYRTLGDILNSMRGLNVSHDDMYGYLAGRGYASPGDYAGRITLLIDGYRAPENVFGQSFFGNDGILDVELIERVEYIPGSGSSSYGDSAFLGVINIVTKKGRDIGGAQVSSEIGSHALRRERVTAGNRFDNGLDILFSVSTLSQAGRHLPQDFGYDSEYLFEKERNHRYFLKAAFEGWTFESAWADRRLVGDFLTDPLFDKNAFANLKYDGEVNEHLRSSTQLYFGRYRYLTYWDASLISSMGGDWWGIDSKLVGTWFHGHTLVVGAEYRDDYRQRVTNLGSPDSSWRSDRVTTSVYAYDDIALSSKLQLTLGGRADARDNGSLTLSPRTAVVYSPLDGTTLKLSSGMAHRQPTVDTERWTANPEVEHLRSTELVLEQDLGSRTRLLASVYRYRIENQAAGGDYVDGVWLTRYEPLNARGFELEAEHRWYNGIRLQGSYAWQHADIGDGGQPINMARNIAKLNLSAPIYGEMLRAGLGVRYIGPHLNKVNSYDPATMVADLTFSSRWRNWFASFSIRNLGDVRYRELGGGYYGDTGSYGAERRNYWLQLGYEFR